MGDQMRHILLILLLSSCSFSVSNAEEWVTFPNSYSGATTTEQGLILESGKWSQPETKPYRWGFAVSNQRHTDVRIRATLRIHEQAKRFGFFGSSWSVWPDPTFGDEGFEAGILFRFQPAEQSAAASGYRVQLSHKYQQLTLVRFPDGGYLQTVPCPVHLNQDQTIEISAVGSQLVVAVDGKERLKYHDHSHDPHHDHSGELSGKAVAFGTSSQAKIAFTNLSIEKVESKPAKPDPNWLTKHQPDFQVRTWIGERPWLFDGNEPIMLLPVPEAKYINNVKLRPGLKPLLSWNSHWGIENQGAFKEGENKNSPISSTGGGKTISISWDAKQINEQFVTSTRMDISYDNDRGTYVYEINSELDVQSEKPFYFRYGYDFEHHTPLDPFGWQYLLIRNQTGRMTYRPLSPYDPGTLNDIQQDGGVRVWYGRSKNDFQIAPAVEYFIQPEWQRLIDDQGQTHSRKLNTAVCAAFYDTGVAFSPETAKPGEKIRVRYRYTGYTPEEAENLFRSAKVQENPRIDPEHHFVFARDQWPRIRFSDTLPMDKPWWGGRPFQSGHNARPSYDIKQVDGRQVLQLGPVSYGVAPVGPAEIEPGRYLVSAQVKSVNTHGPGGRIEVLVLKRSDPFGNGFVLSNQDNILTRKTKLIGSGSFNWREVKLVVSVPEEVQGFALGMGNAGTGEMFVSEVTFRKLGETESVTETPDPKISTKTPRQTQQDVLWDLRMEEQQGFYVYNYGSSTHRTLELDNLDWVNDRGHAAIRFMENPTDRADYPKLGILDSQVRHPVYGKNYAPMKHGAYAIAGHHGGGTVLKGLTLAAWIKPASEMGKSQHQGKGDLIGYGARRFILGLHGQQAPYKLAARINVSSQVESQTTLEADRWYHVAMTCRPTAAGWQIQLFLDGKKVGEGVAAKFPANSVIPDSVILGAELFYLHTSYYRGLMGHTLILKRALTTREIAELAAQRK